MPRDPAWRGTSITENPSESFSLCGPERTTLIAISCGFTGPVQVETWQGRQIGSMPTLARIAPALARARSSSAGETPTES